MIAYLRRYEVSVVEAVFSIAVLAGLIHTALRPDHLSRVVSLGPLGAAHPAITLVAMAALFAVVVWRWLILWGPVRIDRARLRWQMMGPDDRAPVLNTSLIYSSATAIIVCAAVSLALSMTSPAHTLTTVVAGAISGIVAVGAAYGSQLIRNLWNGFLPNGFSLRPAMLHRNIFSPTDGLARSVALAVSMMDMSWLTDARIVRWQRGHVAARARALPAGFSTAVIALDIRRVARDCNTVVRLIVCYTAIVAVPFVWAIHIVPHIVFVVLIYCAGNSVSSGLRQVRNGKSLRVALGRSDALLVFCHSVIPVIATLIGVCMGAWSWHLAPAQAVVAALGSAVAVLRRAARPDIPYDSEVMLDPIVGAAFQPRIVLTLMRGIVAVIVTGVIVGAL